MLRAALVLVWLACCPRPGPAQDLPVPGGGGAAGPPVGPPDVVAVGDVHGDLFYNLATLHSAGVIDDAGHWKLGRGTLIQLGDILDRGDDGRFVLDHYAQLAEEAAQAGGQVIQLLGNHEIMNLGDDLRYVTPGDYALFGGPQERAAALGPKGSYGKRMRGFRLAAALNDTVFVHAGLRKEWAKKGVAEVNRLGAQAIAAGKWYASVLSGDGPVWTRDLVSDAQQGQCTSVLDALEQLSAAEGRPMRRMVVGHTPMKGGKVRFFCDGALVDVDIAMSRGMRGGYFGALAVVWRKDGPSDAFALPRTRRFDKAAVGALARDLAAALRQRYAEEGPS
eukprot:EG_transcript_19099